MATRTLSRSGRKHGDGRRRFVLTGLAALTIPLLSCTPAKQTTAAPEATSSSGASATAASAPTQGSARLRLGVIGAGWLGGTVGGLWVRAGHEVMFSSRHPEELKPMTATLGPRASVGTPREAAEFGTVVLFAVPYDALPQLGRDLAPALQGKIVLDATNAGGDGALAREADANGVAKTSAKYLPGTILVRAFSAVDATAVEASAKRADAKLGVPIASDDSHAIDVAAQLVRDAGCEPVVVGDLSAARGFQRGGPGFRANTTAPELRRLLGLPDKMGDINRR